ncbi:MAG: IS21 family transposase [Tannerellaceae bacterium]|nr:IS21 family transposase [Tannerellaceae bacterium]
MSKIKQVLQLHRDGMSNRNIARELGLYKGTVNGYIRKLKGNDFDIGELLKLEDPELEKKFSAGNPAYTDNRFEVLKGKFDYIEKELSRKHVTRYQLWQEYRREQPSGYGYSQFCYHLSQLKEARHPSAIVEHLPGKELHVDFAGDTLSYVDRETGEVIKVQVFIACFPYSDYTFAMAVPSQQTEEFLYALSQSLQYFGGCPKILIPDNLKAAVIKADKYEPDLNRVMEDFGNHYGFVVIPARSRKPKDKATVENHVKIIYNRVYARLRNEIFFSMEDLNEAIEKKIVEHNQTRMQQKGYSREEKFLAEEKASLSDLPQTAFELKYYTKLRVASNNCIYLGRDKHYYSVPYTHIGQKASVIYTRSLVRIYCNNECVATHPRKRGFGYSTIKEHLCSTHQHYMDRSPEYYISLAEKRSAELGRLIRLNFEHEQTPELLYKRCDGLLSLQRKTDPVVFEKACRYAVEQGLLSYKSLQRIIENKTYQMEPNTGKDPEETNEEKPAPHENIRGRDYYINQLKKEDLWNRSNQN